MRKSRFMEEQITDALWLADSGKKRVYRLCCQEGLQLRMKVKRMRVALLLGRPQVLTGPNPHSEHWIFSTTRCSTDEHFASSRSLISEVARVGLEANFRLSGRCVGQALDRLAAQREWPNVISWTTAWSSRPRPWSSGQRHGVKLDHTRPGKLP